MRDTAPAPQEAVIIGINDVYRIEGIDEGARRGIARLRTLRDRLERAHLDLLLLHAGDMFGPSFLGRTYHGEQMIDALNLLDGRPERGRFDGRMFVAFGNHEFDESTCEERDILRSRVAQSAFTWLASDIDVAACHGAPAMLGDTDRVKPDAIVESGGIRIGLFALLLPFGADDAGEEPEIRPILEVARQETNRPRAQGAQVMVAITHLPVEDDLRIVQTLGRDGPDLIVGGHDHTAMALPEGQPRIFKADADAATANVLFIRLGDDGRPFVELRRESLDAAAATDPMVQQTVEAWLQRHARAFCAEAREAADCLDQALGCTRTVIEGEELKNRTRETGIGDWIADRMREARPEADVALLNSGTLRLNHDLPAGSVLLRRHVEELFGFKSPLLVLRTTGAKLWGAAGNALRHRGEGDWAHRSGLTLAVGDDGRLARLKVRRADGRVEEIRPDSKKQYQIVLSSCVACGGDGYDFGVDLAACGGEAKQCRAQIKDAVDGRGRRGRTAGDRVRRRERDRAACGRPHLRSRAAGLPHRPVVRREAVARRGRCAGAPRRPGRSDHSSGK
ncbi:MAG: 5'-nucleotidase C-terminal domain-containing protein [Rhodospirillaceae bacterium]|nr:5'-nucleotidase C-terminal domain-containing protein [Rhodospirillaceae bacterium]